jgi:hypothetical protein
MFNMVEKITNGGIAKLVSAEFIISTVIAVFVLGGIYTSIQNSIAMAQASADHSVSKTLAVEQAVNDIKVELAGIKSNQAYAAQKDVEQSQELLEQRKDIKKILSILGGGTEKKQREDD